MKLFSGMWALALFAIFFQAPSTAAPIYVIHGLNFSPYIDGQSPDARTQIGYAQMVARMGLIAGDAVWVRTFGMSDGLDQAGEVARTYGRKVAMGAWLDANLAANEVQLTKLVTAAKAGLVDIAILGSEALLRRNLTEAQILAYIARFKAEAPGVPVTYADVYGELLAHPSIINAVDVVFVNYYPYWEGYSVDVAVGAVHAWHQQVKGAAGTKKVVVSETGWPSLGNPVGNAVPSPQNAGYYFLNFVSWARANNVEYFYFAALDETWKVAHEGPQGANWGIRDKNGILKPGMLSVFDGNTIPDNWSGNAVPGGPGSPKIEFSYVPPYGTSTAAVLRGRALHVSPSEFAVAVYIQVSGGWWTKPFFNQPLTVLQVSGDWSSSIVTGGNDQFATKIIAFLVPKTYSPPIAFGGGSLPADLYQQAANYAEVTRTTASLSGRVRDSDGFGIGNVNLILNGTLTLTTSTTPAGDYSFASLAGLGPFTLIASKSGFSFSPASQSFPTLTGPNQAHFIGTTQPGAPSNPSPSSGAANVPLTTTLQWDSAVLAATYDVYFGTSVDPPFAGNTASTAFNPGILSANASYYWRVVAKNSGANKSSSTWSFTTQPSIPSSPPLGDFDGNGKPDLIWQNDSTRQVGVWYMSGAQGATYQGFGWLAGSGVPGWSVVALADLDGNGQPDLIWQNDTTRQVVVWYMGGAKGDQYLSFAWLQSSNSPGWSVVSAADLDGNGKPDLIWQNNATRQVGVWYMGGTQGSVFQSFAWLEGAGTPGWKVVGMGDLDGNGKPDLIWQNDTTRQVVAWYMGGASGAQYQSFSWLQSSNTPGWKIVGLADLDGNAKPDLIWQEDSTRKVAAWYMGGAQGNQFLSFAWLEANGIPGWRALAAR